MFNIYHGLNNWNPLMCDKNMLRFALSIRIVIAIFLFVVIVGVGKSSNLICNKKKLFIDQKIDNCIDTLSIPIIEHGMIYKNLSTYAGIFVNDYYYGLTRTGLYDGKFFIYDCNNHRLVKSILLPYASGGWGIASCNNSIYLGSYARAYDYKARLYKYDILRDTLYTIGTFDEENFVWHLACVENDVYVGTSPNGRIYKYNTLSGKTELLFEFFPLQYVRALTHLNGELFAGLGMEPKLMRINGVNGEIKSILPESFLRESIVYYTETVNNKVVIGLAPSTTLLLYDPNSQNFEKICDSVGHLQVEYNQLARLKTYSFFENLIGFDSISGKVFRIANQDLYKSTVRGNKIIGFTPEGVYKELSSKGKLLFSQNLTLELGISDFPMSFLANDGKLYLGGKGIIEYDVDTRTKRAIETIGEVKSISVDSKYIYGSIYVGNRLYRWPISKFGLFDGKDKKFLVWDIDSGQNRPLVSIIDKDYLYVSSEPDYGKYGGAVAIYPIRKKKPLLLKSIFGSYTPQGLTVSGDRMYIGCSAFGGSGTTPIEGDARLLCIDIKTFNLIFDIKPLPKIKRYTNFCCIDNFLYCLDDSGCIVQFNATNGVFINRFEDYTFSQLAKDINGVLYAMNDYHLYKLDKEKNVLVPLIKSQFAFRIMAIDEKRSAIYIFDESNLIELRL